MVRSIAASLSWPSSIIAVKQATETSSAALRVKNKSLLWHPSRCVEWKATSVTAAEFYGAVILNDLHVPGWIRLSFIYETFALNSLFLLVMWKNLCVFMSHNSAEFRWTLILLSDSVLQTKKLQAKVWNSTCRTISVCKLLQNVNFDDLTFLTALVLYSKSDYLNHSNRDTACFMRV